MSTATKRPAPAPTGAAPAAPSPPRPATPPAPRGPLGPVALLARYLAAASALLALVLLAGPDPAPGEPWAAQRETLQVHGGGALNAYARGVIGATATLTRLSAERQQELTRRSRPADAAAGAARALAAWRARHELPLKGAALALAAGLAAYGVLKRPPTRHWQAGLAWTLAAALLVTHPSGLLGAARTLATGLPAATTAAVVAVGGGTDAAAAERGLADRYWGAFVTQPLARLATGSGVVAGARAEDRPALVEALARRIRAVSDWVAGRRGVERALVATTALAYLLPFAALLAALAMLAAVAQTLLLVLALAGLAAAPAALEPRWRARVRRYWLLPLAGSAAVLAAAHLAALGTMGLGVVLHEVDAQLGTLLAGSILPLGAAAVGVRALRGRRARRSALAEGGA